MLDRTNAQWISFSQLPPEAQTYDADFYDIPGLQTVSNSSLSDTYLSDSDGESDDEISRLGGYLRSAASGRFGMRDNPADGEEHEDEEARMMQEIAERGPEETAAEDIQNDDSDEPQMPAMDYEIPAAEDDDHQRDSSRVVNPPFLTDGRGRVVWSSNGGAGELLSSELRPSGERRGPTEAVGECESKCSGRAKGLSAGENENGEDDEHPR